MIVDVIEKDCHVNLSDDNDNDNDSGDNDGGDNDDEGGGGDNDDDDDKNNADNYYETETAKFFPHTNDKILVMDISHPVLIFC